MLQISPDLHKMVSKVMSQVELKYVLTFSTELDDATDSCLVWKGQNYQLVINLDGVNRNRLGGCYIIFYQDPKNNKDVFLLFEDGFVLQFTDNTYQLFHEAIFSQKLFITQLNNNLQFELK